MNFFSLYNKLEFLSLEAEEDGVPSLMAFSDDQKETDEINDNEINDNDDEINDNDNQFVVVRPLLLNKK